MGVSYGEILNDGQEQQVQAMENALNNLRAAIPAYIVDFDREKQTATVQPTIKECVNGEWQQLPQLLDVPVQFPQAGGYSLTFPVKPGDECLVVFSDMCIDAWWQSGGVQTQIERRRHDLSDALAILGVSSVPNVITDFSPDTVQLRNEAGNTYFEIDGEDINIEARNLNINVREKVELNAPETFFTTIFDVTGDTTIKGKTDIAGNTTIVGETGITGNTSIEGNTTVEGSLSAGGAGGDALIRGNIKIEGTLEVTEDTELHSGLTVKQNIEAIGAISCESLTAEGIAIGDEDLADKLAELEKLIAEIKAML